MKKVITESLVIDLLKTGVYELDISDGAIITPLAKDKIRSAGIRLISNRKKEISFGSVPSYDRVILGSKSLSPKLLDSAREIFFDVKKLTTFRIKNTFPDSLTELIKNIPLNYSDLIVIVSDEAEETAIFANKFPGVRAAVCYDEFISKKLRERVGVNCIIFDPTILTEDKIISLLRIWQSTSIIEEHVAKLNEKFIKIEKYFINRS